MPSDFLWGGRAQPTRGPKPTLTPEHIADAGIAIADAEGLAAVTMQRVAADRGFTKMSLYRYVTSKGELVALMVERAIGAPPAVDLPVDLSGDPSGDPDGWRAALKQWARHLLEAHVRHPWAVEATLGPRPVGPNELAWMECAVTILPSAGLTGTERLDAIAVLAGHVRAIAQQFMVGRHPEEDLATEIAEQLRRHGDRFPALAATMAAAAADGGQDQAFEFGLDRILDGLDLLITRRATS
ncbi:TetR/AcrR family transcriptional regulator [Dactylosporangium cerinum]|uniref:TetR/AcrR family transcriptional regulator n=1 Tax=Dactylosporangium cerinum TaxID=1434730 RepID=A0ABV9VVY8_9ACTN